MRRWAASLLKDQVRRLCATPLQPRVAGRDDAAMARFTRTAETSLTVNGGVASVVVAAGIAAVGALIAAGTALVAHLRSDDYTTTTTVRGNGTTVSKTVCT